MLKRLTQQIATKLNESIANISEQFEPSSGEESEERETTSDILNSAISGDIESEQPSSSQLIDQIIDEQPSTKESASSSGGPKNHPIESEQSEKKNSNQTSNLSSADLLIDLSEANLNCKRSVNSELNVISLNSNENEQSQNDVSNTIESAIARGGYSMNSFAITNKTGEEILPFTIERPEKWFGYFEQQTSEEVADRKKLLTRVLSIENDLKDVMLDHFQKGYEDLKSAVIEHCNSLKKSAQFFAVDYKIPKYRQHDVRPNYQKIYSSYQDRSKTLPLELLKTNLPNPIKSYVMNHEATTIERVIELAEQATGVRAEEEKTIRCFICNKAGHRKSQCYANQQNRYQPYQARGGHGGQGASRGGHRGGRGGYKQTYGYVKSYSNGNQRNYQGNYQGNYRASNANDQFEQHSMANITTREKRANVVDNENQVSVFMLFRSVLSLFRSSNLHRVFGVMWFGERCIVVCILIDSGANLCVLDAKLASKLKLSICKVANSRLKVCGSSAKSLGMAKASLRIGTQTEELTFDVLENVGEELILGFEQFKLFKLWIDRELSLRQDEAVYSRFGEAPKPIEIENSDLARIGYTEAESTEWKTRIANLAEIESGEIQSGDIQSGGIAASEIQLKGMTNKPTLNAPFEISTAKPKQPIEIENNLTKPTNTSNLTGQCGAFKTTDSNQLKHIKTDIASEETNTISEASSSKVASIGKTETNRMSILTKPIKLEPDIEKSFFRKISHLDSKAIKCKLISLFYLIFAVFACTACDLGNIEGREARIKFKPGVQFEKRFAFIDKKNSRMINERVYQLLAKGIIRRSSAQFYSPAFLVDKKDEGEKTRLVVDYRTLNNCIEKLDYKFPIIEDIIDRLSEAKVFSCLDVSQGFYHINIAEEDKPRTAFRCELGVFEFNFLPFGYKNSPAHFQAALEDILKIEGCSEFSMNYIDDIIIWADNEEQHVERLSKVLHALHKHNIKLKLSKCQFVQRKVEYLGFSVSHNCVQPLVGNTEAIKNFPRPTSVASVQQFVGKCNFYRKFIRNISMKLAPLYKLLNRKAKGVFGWNDDCESAFEQMKRELSSKPVLTIFNAQKESYLFTDASRVGIASVLKQKENGVLKPVAYFSKKLTNYQKNYAIVELECLAIVESVRHFHKYLANKKFRVITDHRALVYLQTITNKNTRLLKWSLELSLYDYEISYRKGEENVEADCLSRNPLAYTGEEQSSFMKVVNLLGRREYANAITVEDVENKSHEIVDGLIFKRVNNKRRLFVPIELEVELIKRCHLEFSHIGVEKTVNKLRKSYHIPNLTEKATNFIKNCETCVKNRERGFESLGFLSKLGPAQKPLEVVSIDTVGGLHCNSTKSYLHIAIDNFTRYVWVYASSTQTVKDFEKLINLITEDAGKPEIILCDMYSALKSNRFEKFLTDRDIKLVLTPPNAAQANGMVERVNQSLIVNLRCRLYDLEHEKAWPTVIKRVVDDYNNIEHSVTKFSPSYLLTGRERSIALAECEEPIDLEGARKLALINTINDNKRNANYYNKGRVECELEVGMFCYFRNRQKPNLDKLDCLYEGPGLITGKSGAHTYKVHYNGKDHRVHIGNIRLAFEHLLRLELD